MCLNCEEEFLKQLVMRDTVLNHIALLEKGAHSFPECDIPEIRRQMDNAKYRVEMGMLVENNYAASMSYH